MSRRAVRPLTFVATALIVAGSSVSIRAQDLEPRAYSNSPTGLNFVLLGYGYTTGSVLTDPSLPIENVTNDAHVGVFGFARVLDAFGKSAKFELLVPFAGITAKGLVFRSAAYTANLRLRRSVLSILDQFSRRARIDRGRI